MDGILNIDKPKGLTSHDVVDRVRRWSQVRRVGHAGTLDPMATGVLLVCLGKATRVTEYLMAGHKVYRAVIRLGVTTDTYDAEGEVLETRPVEVDLEQVRATLARFRGRVQQVPPMYSALKRDGQPLYKLARRGITVERPARTVEIFDLTLEDWSPPDLTLTVTCSPGTYIRSLAHDLGERLGCGGHLIALTRLASGRFTLDEAVSLEEVAQAAREGRLETLLYPLDAALETFPAVALSEQDSQRVRSGRSVGRDVAPPSPEGLCRAYDPAGRLLALLRYDPVTDRWRPHKVFLPLG